MEIKISYQPYLLSLILLLIQLVYFTKQVTRKIHFHQEKSKSILILLTYLTLLSFIGYNTFSAFAGYRKIILIYRSVYSNDILDLMQYLESVYELFLKSGILYTLLILIPLTTKKSSEYTGFIRVYSILRLPVYPLIIYFLRDYNYFRMYILEIVNLGEACLLIVFFSTLANTKRVVEEYNLIETYEYEYIFLRLVSKCKLILVELGMEIISRILLIYLMTSEIKSIITVMNLLYTLKVVYTLMMINSMITVIFCKEQETFDNLMNFTEVKREIKKKIKK